MERTLYFMLNYLKNFRPICALDHLLPTVYMLFSVYRLWIVAIFCFNIIHTWIGRICRWMGFKESVGGKNKKLCHFLLYFDEIYSFYAPYQVVHKQKTIIFQFQKYCGVNSHPFVLGESCQIGIAFWLALGGTVCTVLASSLAIWAYQSTRSQK